MVVYHGWTVSNESNQFSTSNFDWKTIYCMVGTSLKRNTVLWCRSVLGLLCRLRSSNIIVTSDIYWHLTEIHCLQLDTAALRKYAMMMSQMEQGRGLSSPYLMPRVPLPPRFPLSGRSLRSARYAKSTSPQRPVTTDVCISNTFVHSWESMHLIISRYFNHGEKFFSRFCCLWFGDYKYILFTVFAHKECTLYVLRLTSILCTSEDHL